MSVGPAVLECCTLKVNSPSAGDWTEMYQEVLQEKKRDLGQLLYLGIEDVAVSPSLQEEGRCLFLGYGMKCFSNHLELLSDK